MATSLLTTLLACDTASVGASTRDARVNTPPADAARRPDAAADIEDAVSDPGEPDAAEPAPRDAGLISSARENLVIHEFWSTPTEDPFDDRPADAGCNRAGIMPELLAEEPVFSVDTGFCGYITVAQPTLREIAAGQSIKVRLWHFELSAPMPAQAHAAVLVDGLHVLDELIPIPSPGGLLVRELVAPRAIPKGASVYFHLHNHGSNSWSLVEVSAGPCGPTACP